MEKTTARRTAAASATAGAKVEEKTVTKPVESELKIGAEDLGTPAPAATPEKVQTDVRTRLAKKTDVEDMFVPSTPKQVEDDAKEVAANSGFEFNRGTSVGARLMVRALQNFPK